MVRLKLSLRSRPSDPSGARATGRSRHSAAKQQRTRARHDYGRVVIQIAYSHFQLVPIIARSAAAPRSTVLNVEFAQRWRPGSAKHPTRLRTTGARPRRSAWWYVVFLLSPAPVIIIRSITPAYVHISISAGGIRCGHVWCGRGGG